MRQQYGATLLTLFLLMPQILSAQVTSFVCNFDVECTPDNGCEEKTMDLIFFLNEQGQAYMQGNANLVQVISLAGDQAYSFVEPAGFGIVQSTSVLRNGTAVHSRHTAIAGEFVVSQWHGKCSTFGGAK
ncbi:hypothetical protein ABLN87_03500 [Ruegeria sp. SCPT10]|uniref:hypothetical protein n=1 Tax=Ruegeria sp. SCP10 TaxID=3141377 RepID=UPI00333C77CE